MAETEKPTTIQLDANLRVETLGFKEAIAMVKQVKAQMLDLHQRAKVVLEIPSGVKGVGLASEVQMHIKAAQIFKGAMEEVGRALVLAREGVKGLDATLLKYSKQGILEGQVKQHKANSKELENQFRMQVRAGELKVGEIRKLKDEQKLKWAIAELDDMNRKKETQRTTQRLRAAQLSLDLLRQENVETRKLAAEKIRMERAGIDPNKYTSVKEYQAEGRMLDEAYRLNLAHDKKRTSEKVESARKAQAWEFSETQKLNSAAKKEREDAHAEALKEEATRRKDYRSWWAGALEERDVRTGRALPEDYKDLQQGQRVRQQKFSIIDIARAENEKLIPSLQAVAKATNLVWLQEELRYAGIRKRRGFDQIEEQERINAIRTRIKLLGEEAKAAEKTRPATPITLTQADHIKVARRKMSSYTNADFSDFTGMHPAQLSALKQGQNARYLAGVGAGNTQAANDALQLLSRIKQHEADIIAQRKAGAVTSNGQALTAQQLADKAYKLRVAEVAAVGLEADKVQKLNSLAEVGLQIDAAKLRMKQAIANQQDKEAKKEDELIQKLTRHKQVLARQAEDPEDRARINAYRRQDTRERLFGDGGASTLLVQAGLMAGYQALGGIQSLFSGAISSAVEFDAALKQLQAISAATRNEMVDLKASLIEVAQGSKFSAAEVAQASVLLAQAGLSINEIQHTMKAVIQLATASGSELKKSVDVMTSVLSVFDMSASQSESVANKLTAALNRSKLDIDKMALGLQYAGNAAADAGVNFDELVSGLSAMANAGIRSGSTLGTGLRQLFVDIQKPSQNFQEILARLGISLSDVDIRAQGFEGVLRNLIDKGFTSAEAFKAFQIRSASAFAALSNNIDTFHDMQDAIQGTNAALEANAIQMESMSVQYDHLKSNLGILAAEGFKPLLLVIRNITSGFAHMAESVDKSGATLKVVFTAIGTVLTTMAIAAGTNALLGVIRLTGGFRNLLLITPLATLALAKQTAGLAALEAGAKGAALWNAVLFRGMQLLRFTPILLGIGLAAAAFGAFSSEAEKLKDNLDEAKTNLNQLAEANDQSKQQIEGIDGAVKTLSERYGRLSQHSSELETYVRSLAEQFKNQGVTLSDLSGKTIPELIAKLNELRDTLSGEYILRIQEEGAALEAVNKLEIQKQYSEAKSLAAKLPSSYSMANHTRAAKLAGIPTTTSNPALLGPQEAILAARELVNSKNRGLMPKEGLGAYTNLGTLRRDLASYQQDPELSRNKPLAKQVDDALRILDLMDSVHNKQRAALQIPKDTQARMRAERLIAERRGDETSGFDRATQSLMDLSQNNVKSPDNIAFLEAGVQALKAESDRVGAALKAVPESDAGDRMARQKELQELAEALSRYETQLQPLLLKRDNDEMALLKAKLESIQQEEKTVRAKLEGELNPAVRDNLNNEQARLIEDRQVAEKKLRTLEEKRSKVSEAVRKANAARLEEDMRQELLQLSSQANKGNADAKARLRKLLQESGQLIDDAFNEQYNLKFEELDKGLQRELKDQKAFGGSQRKALSDRLMMLELRGSGYNTDQRLFKSDSDYPSEMGTLGLRSRIAARLQGAAAKREMLKSESQLGLERANLLGSRLPELRKAQADQEQLLLVLEASKKIALEAQAQRLADTQRRLAAGESLGPNAQAEIERINDEAKAATKAFQEAQDALDKMQEKVEGYQRERQALLLSYAQENDGFKTLFDALKVGVEGATQAISDALGRIISRTGDVKEAFEDMSRGILASMLKVLTDKIAEQFIGILLDMVPGMFRGSGKDIGNAGGAGLKNTLGTSRNGGLIRRAEGGFVPGMVARDSVPTLLMPGEFVLQKSASSALGEDFLNGLNRTTSATLRQGEERAKKAAQPEENAGGNLVNVWVVTPDQQVGLSKDDIVVTVSDNIVRGGSLRRLIKQVQVGA
jgi:TP901 family phage tail tape measure protein